METGQNIRKQEQMEREKKQIQTNSRNDKEKQKWDLKWFYEHGKNRL